MSRRAVRILPGEATLDADLLAETVDWLVAHRASSTLQTRLAIGERILTRLFASAPETAPDLAAWERCGLRHVTYRALADHPDCPWSASHLNRCVRLSVQHRQLPSDLSRQLGLRECAALVPVPMPDKQKFAQRAVDHGWDHIRLETEVANWLRRHRPVRSGRPRTSAAAKVVTRIRREVLRATELKTRTLPDDPAERARLAGVVIQRSLSFGTSPCDSEPPPRGPWGKG